MTHDIGPTGPEGDIRCSGDVDPEFEAVREAFERVLDAHPGGLGLAVYADGREVVNLWAV